MTIDTSTDPIDMASASIGADLALTLSTVTDPAQWSALLATTDRPHLPQTWAYGEAKRARGWTPVRIVFADRGTPVAMAQILEFRILGLRLGARLNRGPMLLGAKQGPERTAAIYRALRQRFGRWFTGPLSIAPGLEKSEANDALLERLGYRRRTPQTWWSSRIDLSSDHPTIRAGLASTFRNRLKKSEQGSLSLRVANDPATIAWMIARHTENMADKGFNAASERFLNAFAANAPEDLLIFQALHEGQPVAGMSVVRFADIAEYHTGWFGPAARDANAGNFLMWSIMREMKARGCTSFDVGGLYAGHGYTQFKRGMRGREYVVGGEWMSF